MAEVKPAPTSNEENERRSLFARLTAFETALVAGGVVLFLALLYAMWDFMSPLLIGAAGAILLWPLREYDTVRALLMAGGFLLLLWFLSGLSEILLPFALVYLLAYLLDPLVYRLQVRWGVRRWILSLAVTALVVGAFALFVMLLIPSIVGELEVLLRRALDGISGLREWLATAPLFDNLEAAGLLNRDEIVNGINSMLQEQSKRLADSLPRAAQGVVQSIGSLVGTLTIIAAIPVVLYYTLKDYRVIRDRLIELFPTLGGRRDYLLHASSVVGNYLRGQLTICAIAAFNVSVLLTIFDVPFALLLGLLAGLLNLIPNLGALITNIIAVTVAFIFGDPWLKDVIVVLAVLIGQGLLEQSLLTPKILSHHVGLHPVLILLSLFVFGYFMGIFGLLIAVPTTALLMAVYKAYREELTLELSRHSTPPSSPPEHAMAGEPVKEEVH